MPPPIFVLNLDRRPDRAAFMDQQLTAMGLPYQRVSALDGHTATEDVLASRISTGPKKMAMGRGSQAAAVGAFRIFERIAQGGAAYGVVMQDDIQLAPDLPCLLGDLSWIPEGAELIQLEHYGRQGAKRLLGRARPTPCKGRQLYEIKDRHLGAGCYIISARFCAALLADDPKLDMPDDHFLFNPELSPIPQRAQAQIVVPALARQQTDRLASDLAQERSRDDRPGSGLSWHRKLSKETRRAWGHIKGVAAGYKLREVRFSPRPAGCACPTGQSPTKDDTPAQPTVSP